MLTPTYEFARASSGVLIPARVVLTHGRTGLWSSGTTHALPDLDPWRVQPALAHPDNAFAVFVNDSAALSSAGRANGEVHRPMVDRALLEYKPVALLPETVGQVCVLDRRGVLALSPDGGDGAPESMAWALHANAANQIDQIGRFIHRVAGPPRTHGASPLLIIGRGYAGSSSFAGGSIETSLAMQSALGSRDAISFLFSVVPNFQSIGSRDQVHFSANATAYLLSWQALVDAILNHKGLGVPFGATTMHLLAAALPVPNIVLFSRSAGTVTLSVEALNLVVADLTALVSVRTGLTPLLFSRLPFHRPTVAKADEHGCHGLFMKMGYFRVIVGANAAVRRHTHRALAIVLRGLLHGSAAEVARAVDRFTVDGLGLGLDRPAPISYSPPRDFNREQILADTERRLTEQARNLRFELERRVDSQITRAIDEIVDEALASGGWQSLPTALRDLAVDLDARAKDLGESAEPWLRPLRAIVGTAPAGEAPTLDDHEVDDENAPRRRHGLLGLFRFGRDDDDDDNNDDDADDTEADDADDDDAVEGGVDGPLNLRLARAVERRPQAEIDAALATRLRAGARHLMLMASRLEHTTRQLQEVERPGGLLTRTSEPADWTAAVRRPIPTVVDIVSKEADRTIFAEVQSIARVSEHNELVADPTALRLLVGTCPGLRSALQLPTGAQRVVDLLAAEIARPFRVFWDNATLSSVAERFGVGLAGELTSAFDELAPFLDGFMSTTSTNQGQPFASDTFLEIDANEPAAEEIERLARDRVSGELRVAARQRGGQRGDPQVVILRMSSGYTFNHLEDTRPGHQAGTGGPGFEALAADLERYARERIWFPFAGQQWRRLALETHPEIARRLGLRLSYDEPASPPSAGATPGQRSSAARRSGPRSPLQLTRLTRARVPRRIDRGSPRAQPGQFP